MSKRKDLLGWIRLEERTSPRGWSIEIMPQEIRVDNYHGRLHIHPPRDDSVREPIRARSTEQVREIIRQHAERNKTVVYKKLVEELR